MRIRCFGGAAIGFLRSDRFLIPRLWVARSRLGIGRWSNTIPFGPSQPFGQGKTATTRPAPFCGRATTSPILAGETLRVVNLRNGDRRDRNRKDGGAKENRDDESGHFPSDGVQPIFRRKSLQLTADPRWSTESVTWPGPLHGMDDNKSCSIDKLRRGTATKELRAEGSGLLQQQAAWFADFTEFCSRIQWLNLAFQETSITL